jgi:hypothetical protein
MHSSSVREPGGIPSAGSLPDLRENLAALLGEVTPFDQFLEWYLANADDIEFDGTDADVELLNVVAGLLDEYTGNYIDAAEVLNALRTAPLVQEEIAPYRAAVA